MSAPISISDADLSTLLSEYELGDYLSSRSFTHGEGQTTALIITSRGGYVLKCYENRSHRHVLFEINLIRSLSEKNYPVPTIIPNRAGESLGRYRGKPYVFMTYLSGEHCKHPGEQFDHDSVKKIVEVVARLHLIADCNKKSVEDREEFNSEYCLREYQRLSTSDGAVHTRWLKSELDKLEFPSTLPRGVCHADLNNGNFLFSKGEIVAVLDFDLSFHTVLIYDVASLLYWWAFLPDEGLRNESASFIVREYSMNRRLSAVEERHIYDALKLIVLLGFAWSGGEDLIECKTAIDYLDGIGRDEFHKRLFKDRRKAQLADLSFL